MERITATIDSETLAKIRRIAGPRGVSGFLAVAANERIAKLELLGLLDDLDAQHGAVPSKVVSQVAADASRIFGSKGR